jgi:site-specific recombinase
VFARLQAALALCVDAARRAEYPLPALKSLVDALRPGRVEAAADNLRELRGLLTSDEAYRHGLSRCLGMLFAGTRQVTLYADSGVRPRGGFFAELARRVGERLLPEVRDTQMLRHALRELFPRVSDADWVNDAPDVEWIMLFQALSADEDEDAEASAHAFAQMREALLVLSYRVAAIGLDPEFVRVDPDLEDAGSPLIELSEALRDYLGAADGSPAQPAADRALLLTLDRGRREAERVHERASGSGASLALTYQLKRLDEHLTRIARLVEVLNAHAARSRVADTVPMAVTLMKRMVEAECRRNRLRDFWHDNMSLLSRRVTENAARGGEHYIAADRAEYFRMWRSAMLGGAAIALMAMNKLHLARLGLAPLVEGLAFCLNYGLGFVFIHIIHGTVATKQPAMTAAALAAAMGGESDDYGERDFTRLFDLTAAAVRSQIAAILGNVMLAVPMAMLLGLAYASLSGAPYIDAAKAGHLLHDVSPLSAAPIYAALAGVCLFLAGVVSGYHDNFAVYHRLAPRIKQLGWARLAFGARRVARFANYVEANLGALAGNFWFGFMLGGIALFGVLLGLPLDIRHIAFSSAYLGFAAVAPGIAVTAKLIGMAALGVGLIGLINLGVSFALSLRLAFRARGVTAAQRRAFMRGVWRHMRRAPAAFLLPPRRGRRA